MTEFDRFRELVFADRALQDALMAETNPEVWIEMASRMARARGYTLNAEDIRQEMRASRLAWLERFAG